MKHGSKTKCFTLRPLRRDPACRPVQYFGQYGVFIIPASAVPQSHALALRLRRFQYCCCWAVGAGDVSTRESLRLRTGTLHEPILSHDELVPRALTTPIHLRTHSDFTSPVCSFLTISAFGRCLLHCTSLPPLFAALLHHSPLPPGKLHSLNCWTPAPAPAPAILITPNSDIRQHHKQTLLSISLQSIPVPQHRFSTNIVFDCAHCLDSVSLSPASSQASRSLELLQTKHPRFTLDSTICILQLLTLTLQHH
jgi:hypothetical protein